VDRRQEMKVETEVLDIPKEMLKKFDDAVEKADKKKIKTETIRAVLRKYYPNLSIREIADIIGIPRSTMSEHLSTMRRAGQVRK